MTKDWLKDKNTGTKFYPITHEDAVIDSNGVTLSTKLKGLELSNDYSKFLKLYLTFEAVEAGTFTLTIGANVSTSYVTSISYSLDNGSTWTTTNNVDSLTVTITTPTIAIGNTVLWKGTATALATTTVTSSLAAASRLAEACNFTSTGSYDVYGNIMSLLYGDNFENLDSFASGSSRNFALLFYGTGDSALTKVRNAEYLILPAKICPDYCYYRMFLFSALITPPIILATTLGDYGCGCMFYKCPNLIRTANMDATTIGSYGYCYMYHTNTSLIESKDFSQATLGSYCYCSIFNGCTSLIKAPKLPATTLTSGCYLYMFYNCTSLVTAPELPATTLAEYCYDRMFYGCTALTNVQTVLPALTVPAYCYSQMFRGCTSLRTAPELPATTIGTYCYVQMFFGCSSLVKGPSILPATTLANYCYAGMFTYCSLLTTAPELPAATLVSNCYDSMLAITSINYIKCLATDISATECTNAWVEDVASTGTFIKADSMESWTTGDNGIPSGWNVYTKSEYEVVRHYELDQALSNISLMTPILYDDLKTLKNNGELSPGMFYRITDYETITDLSDSSIKSAGHLFDVIVLALTENELSEDAWACKSARDNEIAKIQSSGTYRRYPDADGDYDGEHYYAFRGIVYLYIKSLTDSTQLTAYRFYGNSNYGVPITEATYFLTQTITSCTIGYFGESNLSAWKLKYCLEGNGKYHWDGLSAPPYITLSNNARAYRDNYHDANGAYCWIYGSGRDDYYYYTVSELPQIGDTAYLNSDLTGNTLTVTSIDDYGTKGVIYRMIDENNNDCPYDFKNIMMLNYDDNEYYYTFNTLDNGMHLDISLDLHNCNNNIIEAYWEGTLPYNIFMNLYNSPYTRHNILKSGCTYNIFGRDCSYNTLEKNCSSNTFGNYSSNNILKLGVSNIIFGLNCNENIIESYCLNITLGENTCSIRLGTYCNNITFNKDNCANIIIEPCNLYITITSTQTTSDSNILLNFTITLGVNNTYNTKTISHNTVNDTFRTVYQPVNSVIVSV